jgi:hypothetical protein
MDRLLVITALAAFVAGARQFFNTLNRNRKNRLQARKLEVWEDEGGAVPLHSTRTAAQVAPRRVSVPSSRGVG